MCVHWLVHIFSQLITVISIETWSLDNPKRCEVHSGDHLFLWILQCLRWYVLEREGGRGGPFVGKLHLRLCFDGGYHVMDESSNYISDTRPTARQLWRPSLGILELGIHGANNLLPMKTTKDNRGSTDAYCVAKYGPKWIRTRTIFESFNPRWNEQYTWEVHDPCTVITVGVFDNRYVNCFFGVTIINCLWITWSKIP